MIYLKRVCVCNKLVAWKVSIQESYWDDRGNRYDIWTYIKCQLDIYRIHLGSVDMMRRGAMILYEEIKVGIGQQRGAKIDNTGLWIVMWGRGRCWWRDGYVKSDVMMLARYELCFAGWTKGTRAGAKDRRHRHKHRHRHRHRHIHTDSWIE